MAIECSQVAYEKLQDAGIEKRLNDREEDIENILLSRTIWEGRSRKLVDEAIGDASRTGMSDEFYKDVAVLSKKLEDDCLCLDMSSKNLPDHPFLLGGVVFGSDIGSFQKYGFESEKDFVEAITAYSIGERDSYGGCDHVWRSNGRKNEINLIGNLGDSCVLQIDVSGAGPVLRDPLSYGFGWKQDSSQFLAIALKYVEALGMRDCDEIKNWEKIVAELRHPCGNGYYSWIEGGKEISSEVKSLMDHYCLPVAGSVPEMSRSEERRVGKECRSGWSPYH